MYFLSNIESKVLMPLMFQTPLGKFNLPLGATWYMCKPFIIIGLDND